MAVFDQPSSPSPAAIVPKTSETLMTSLLERLKSSADLLEGIHVSLNGNDGRDTDSGLKRGAEGVDYIYRTGRA